MRPATPVRVVLATLLVISGGGFALAAREERSREAASAKAFGAPEGSPAREAAERGVSPPPSNTVPTAPTPTTANPLAAPEGSLTVPTILPVPTVVWANNGRAMPTDAQRSKARVSQSFLAAALMMMKLWRQANAADEVLESRVRAEWL